MANKGSHAVDAEMQLFQDDLLQSVREFKAGDFAFVTEISSLCDISRLSIMATCRSQADKTLPSL